MDSELRMSNSGGLSGMSNIGDVGIEESPIKRLLPSLSRIQYLPISEGKGSASIARDLSSDLIRSHPSSVKCKYAPLLPATRSLSTSPSFLSLRNSADACGIWRPMSLAKEVTVAPPSDNLLRSLLRYLLRILIGVEIKLGS